MNIFVLNCGSSSIKCTLFQNDSVWEGRIEWKNGFEAPRLSIKKKDGASHVEPLEQKDPFSALEYLISHFPKAEIHAVGHRVVHGGSLKKSAAITAHAHPNLPLRRPPSSRRRRSASR